MMTRIASRSTVAIIVGLCLSSCALLKNRKDVDQMAASKNRSSDTDRSTKETSVPDRVSDSNASADPEERFVNPESRANDVPRKRIMVLPFLDADPENSGQATKIARDALILELSKSDDLVLVGPTDFPKNFTNYIKDGEYDLPAMAKIANTLGISALLEGKLFEVRAKRIGDSVGFVRQIKVQVDAKIRIRLIASKNSQILLDDTRTSNVELNTTRLGSKASSDHFLEENPKLTEDAVKKAFITSVVKIERAADKLSWEGHIAMIKGDKIYLNAGRLSGLQVGDILKVMEEGEDVYDPETGSLVGRVPGRLKGTLELVSYFGKDGAVSVIHSGAGFKENDVVQLY